MKFVESAKSCTYPLDVNSAMHRLHLQVRPADEAYKSHKPRIVSLMLAREDGFSKQERRLAQPCARLMRSLAEEV
jgi:hypothetical protein